MLEEIRLTPDEIMHEVIVHEGRCSVIPVATATANAATDKAIKGILNHMNSRDVGGVNPEWAISNTFHQALKNLVKEQK